MGFEIYTGPMGGGKSYAATEFILVGLKENAHVHTNIDLIHEEVEARGYSDKVHMLTGIDPTRWKDHLVAGQEGAENLLVIDEAGMNFHVHDAREQAAKYRELFQILIWSRKLGLDVVFISQHLDNLDAQLRRVAVSTLNCRAVKTIPFVGWLLAKLRGDFVRTRRSSDGKRALGRTFHRFKAEVGSFYKTDAMSGNSYQLKRSVTRQSKAMGAEQRKGIFWIVVLGCVLGLCAWGAVSMYSKAHAGLPVKAAGAAPVADVKPKDTVHTVAGFPLGSDRRYEPPRDSSERRVLEASLVGGPDVIFYTDYFIDSGTLNVGTRYGRVRAGGFFHGAKVVTLELHGYEGKIVTEDGRSFVLQPQSYQARELRDQQQWNTQRQLSPGPVPVSSPGQSSASPSLQSSRRWTPHSNATDIR